MTETEEKSITLIHYDQTGGLMSELTIPIESPMTIESFFKKLGLKDKDYYVTTRGGRPRAGHYITPGQAISMQDVEIIYE